MLILKHTALVCASEENADIFYKKLLGLKKESQKTLPRNLSAAIFSVNKELQIINYIGDSSAFEIFIDSQSQGRPRQIEHTCIEFEDRVAFLNACQDLGVKTNLVQKEENEMLKYKNFGRKSLTELVEKLDEMGLHFGMDISKYLQEEV